MKTSAATRVKKSMTALGAGLLEVAAEAEGAKGCSQILCVDPVCLEPPFAVFDGQRILSGDTSVSSRDACPTHLRMATWTVFTAPEDVLTIGWMEDLNLSLCALEGPFAFELFGGEGRVSVRIAVPERQVPGVHTAVNGLFPSVRLKRETTPFPRKAVAHVEEQAPVSPYHRSLTLLGKEGSSPLSTAAVAIGRLESGERGLFQVLLQPAGQDHDWHYNVENLVEAEQRAGRSSSLGGLSSDFSYDSVLPPRMEPSAPQKVQVDVGFMATVVRYAFWGSSGASLESYLQGMRVAMSMVRFGNRPWRRIPHEVFTGNLGPKEVDRMIKRRLSHRCGLMLTTREVATLVHFPNARNLEMLPFIEQRKGLEWLPRGGDDHGPEGKVKMGRNDYAGQSRDVELSMPQRLLHMHMVGGTGSGKSNLMENMVLQDTGSGTGLCLVDPHGDLVLSVLSRMPEERMADLVYISFGEKGFVPRFNPFRTGHDPGKVADDMTHAFLAAAGVRGARMEHNFRMSSFTICELKGTFDDLSELLTRDSAAAEDLRVRAIQKICNRQVRRFLEDELPKYRGPELESVRNKLSRLLTDRQLEATFTQKDNDLHPREWMDQGKVVLVNLSSGIIGTDHARFVGGLIVSLIHRAALSRGDTNEGARRPFVVYLDECQRLQTAPLEEMLSEARKYGLALTLAHQEGGQLGTALSEAIGNCASRVVFRTTEGDASIRRKTLLNRVEERDLLALGVGEAFVVNGDRVASLTTELCDWPVLRNGRKTARRFASRNYARVDRVGSPAKPPRRPRVHDSLEPGREP